MTRLLSPAVILLAAIIVFAGSGLMAQRGSIEQIRIPQEAVVEYEEPPHISVTPVYPTGTQSSPTPMMLDTLHTFVCTIKSNVGTPHAYVDFYDGLSGVKLDRLTLQVYYKHEDDTGMRFYEARGDYLFESPPSTGLWEIRFRASHYDAREEKSYVHNAYVYAVPAEEATPSGTFYINNVAASSRAIIKVYNPKLAFRFEASREGGLITRVQVSIRNPQGAVNTVTLVEDEPDTEWTGQHTLPGYGTYIINGTISTASGSLQLMSIMAPYEEKQGLDGSSLMLIGVGAIAAFLMAGVAWRRRR